jgi:hypothetical protein
VFYNIRKYSGLDVNAGPTRSTCAQLFCQTTAKAVPVSTLRLTGGLPRE